jgi:hypothetical protein
MNSDRDKPGVAFWASVVVVVVALVGYPLSPGPAAWLRVHVLPKSTRKAMDNFYWPLGIVTSNVPGGNRLAIEYVCLWVDFNDLMKTATDL